MTLNLNPKPNLQPNPPRHLWRQKRVSAAHHRSQKQNCLAPESGDTASVSKLQQRQTLGLVFQLQYFPICQVLASDMGNVANGNLESITTDHVQAHTLPYSNCHVTLLVDFELLIIMHHMLYITLGT